MTRGKNVISPNKFITQKFTTMEKIKTQTEKVSGRFGSAFAMMAILLANFSLQAQYESFFGRESWEYANATYIITKSTADYDPYLLSCWTEIYHFTSSDTVTIDGKVYYNSSFYGLENPFVKLREDTLQGHLYSLIGGREFLICDMSLEAGDTFCLPVVFYYSYELVDTLQLFVDSVTFVNSKKVIYLSAISQEVSYWWPFFGYEGLYNITLRFMEGVGPMYGIIPPHQLGDIILCLTKDDSLYYMTHPDLGCWQDYVSVSDYPEQSLTIFPNPAKDKVSVLFENEEEVVGNIIIRDMAGRVCRTFTVTGKNTSLDVSFLSQGMYFLTYSGGTRMITRKFMKE